MNFLFSVFIFEIIKFFFYSCVCIMEDWGGFVFLFVIEVLLFLVFRIIDFFRCFFFFYIG